MGLDDIETNLGRNCREDYKQVMRCGGWRTIFDILGSEWQLSDVSTKIGWLHKFSKFVDPLQLAMEYRSYCLQYRSYQVSAIATSLIELMRHGLEVNLLTDIMVGWTYRKQGRWVIPRLPEHKKQKPVLVCVTRRAAAILASDMPDWFATDSRYIWVALTGAVMANGMLVSEALLSRQTKVLLIEHARKHMSKLLQPSELSPGSEVE